MRVRTQAMLRPQVCHHFRPWILTFQNAVEAQSCWTLQHRGTQELHISLCCGPQQNWDPVTFSKVKIQAPNGTVSPGWTQGCSLVLSSSFHRIQQWKAVTSNSGLGGGYAQGLHLSLDNLARKRVGTFKSQDLRDHANRQNASSQQGNSNYQLKKEKAHWQCNRGKYR